jgi:hypothetical protein
MYLNWFVGTCIGPVTGCCDHGNEPWPSIKCGEFIHWLLNKGFSLSWLFGYLTTPAVLMQHD